MGGGGGGRAIMSLRSDSCGRGLPSKQEALTSNFGTAPKQNKTKQTLRNRAIALCISFLFNFYFFLLNSGLQQINKEKKKE
jgi:hypothetical protein